MGIRRTVVIGAVTAAFLLGGPTAAGYDSELLSEPFLQSASQGNSQQRGEKDGPAYRLHQYLGGKPGAYFETEMPDGKKYVGRVMHICGDSFHFLQLKLYDSSVVGSGFLEIPDQKKEERLKNLEPTAIFGKTDFSYLGSKDRDSYRKNGENQKITSETDNMFGTIIDKDIIGKKR